MSAELNPAGWFEIQFQTLCVLGKLSRKIGCPRGWNDGAPPSAAIPVNGAADQYYLCNMQLTRNIMHLPLFVEPKNNIRALPIVFVSVESVSLLKE